MSLSRQTRFFILIGAVQWLLDWAVMVSLSALGVPVRVANVAGRICGASLGFLLNGRITFASAHTAVGKKQLMRFLTMWLGTTAVSTWAIGAIDATAGLQGAWLAKPFVEVTLAAAGFLLSRHWVYRR